MQEDSYQPVNPTDHREVEPALSYDVYRHEQINKIVSKDAFSIENLAAEKRNAYLRIYGEYMQVQSGQGEELVDYEKYKSAVTQEDFFNLFKEWKNKSPFDAKAIAEYESKLNSEFTEPVDELPPKIDDSKA